METTFWVSNMVGNTVLVGVAGWLFKKWMTKQEATTADNAATVKADLKEHRDWDDKRCDEIVKSIDKLTEQVRTANGRTSKLETTIAVQIERCEQKTGRRKDDRCAV